MPASIMLLIVFGGIARELGVVDESIKKGLLKYKGVERRFQYHGVFSTNCEKNLN